VYLNYSKIKNDGFGKPEAPLLRLQTKYGRNIGILSNTSNLKITVKYSEPSEISFDVAAYHDGTPTPFYNGIVGYKRVYTENYGVYLLMNPETEGDGVEEVKHVKGYSIEKELESKSFFLEEGTFNFWNPASPTSTIVGRILEIATGWSVGYVSPALIGRYRTFDQYDENLMSFVYNTAPEKYRCVFVFDPYEKTISAYDADEAKDTLGIYLDYDNLVTSLSISERSDELVTALRAYGADELSVREVNPIGTEWQYDLTYFIENGDIPDDLAKKWISWQAAITANRERYRGLVALKSSALAQMMAQNAALTDLQADLDDLTGQQSQTIQGLALEITDAGREYQQGLLDDINQKIKAKKQEISTKKAEIAEIEERMGTGSPNSYQTKINEINAALAIDKYFSASELETLRHFFIEDDITEDSFVATDVNVNISGKSYSFPSREVSVSGSEISAIDMTDGYRTQMYTLAGGGLNIKGTLTCDIIRGTLEVSKDNSFVLSVYGGDISTGGEGSSSGSLTLTGTMSGFTSDIRAVDEGEKDLHIIVHKGTKLSFVTGDISMYLTADISDYQALNVEMELFDYAKNVLCDLATPTYEFSVDTGNFIFAKEFERFKNELELGSGIHLRISKSRVITPILIEIGLDFENWSNLSLTFSNRFKLHDSVNTLKDILETSYSAGRNLDASKYIYGKTVEQATAASRFMSSSLDAAVNSIVGAKDETVRIDGGGIHVGGEDGKYQLRVIGSMIAMTDDGWEHAKLAIGRFASKETGEYWGVNAEVIGGKLIVGNNLIIENVNDMGVMQFKVDAGGAWLNNATMCVQCDDGGKILIDPRYGIMAGTGDLYTVDGTTVKPNFIGAGGKIITDSYGIPQNANFYLDARTGKAYFRGDGVFNGTIHARDGDFSGTIKASILEGTLTGSPTGGGAIKGVSLDIGDGAFVVNQNGDVHIERGTISWGAVTGTDEIDDRISSAQSRADSAYSYASRASSSAADAKDLARKIANGEYSNGTFINGREIYSPTIFANTFKVIPETEASADSWTGGYELWGYYGNTLYDMLKISYFQGDAPFVVFSSPCGAYASWDFRVSRFYGRIDFSGANVSGIYAKFK